MSRVIIIPPNNTPEQEAKAVREFEEVLEMAMLKEYGIETKVTLIKGSDKKKVS